MSKEIFVTCDGKQDCSVGVCSRKVKIVHPCTEFPTFGTCFYWTCREPEEERMIRAFTLFKNVDIEKTSLLGLRYILEAAEWKR